MDISLGESSMPTAYKYLIVSISYTTISMFLCFAWGIHICLSRQEITTIITTNGPRMGMHKYWYILMRTQSHSQYLTHTEIVLRLKIYNCELQRKTKSKSLE